LRAQGYIKTSGVAPPPVLQPLPAEEGSALVWLFFLHMPPLLRQLGRATFLAQVLSNRLLLVRVFACTCLCKRACPHASYFFYRM